MITRGTPRFRFRKGGEKVGEALPSEQVILALDDSCPLVFVIADLETYAIILEVTFIPIIILDQSSGIIYMNR